MATEVYLIKGMLKYKMHYLYFHLLFFLIAVIAITAAVKTHHDKDHDHEGKSIEETSKLVLSPLTTYAYLGSNVTITCTRMDDFDVQIGFQHDFVIAIVNTTANSVNGTLTALINSISYNKTKIKCSGETNNLTLYNSIDTATIIIQGIY
jgi:hypothetical protein